MARRLCVRPSSCDCLTRSLLASCCIVSSTLLLLKASIHPAAPIPNISMFSFVLASVFLLGRHSELSQDARPCGMRRRDFCLYQSMHLCCTSMLLLFSRISFHVSVQSTTQVWYTLDDAVVRLATAYSRSRHLLVLASIIHCEKNNLSRKCSMEQSRLALDRFPASNASFSYPRMQHFDHRENAHTHKKKECFHLA